MSSKKATTRATRTVAPSGQGLGQEGGPSQEATAASTPSTLLASSVTLPAMEAPHQQEATSPTSPAVEAFTPDETAPNSAEGAGDTGTQQPQQCDLATASMGKMEAELHHLEQLQRHQQMQEKILTLRAKVSRVVAEEARATVAPPAQMAPQEQAGQAPAVPTITLQEAGPRPPDAPTMSATTAAAPLNQGVGTAPITGALPQGPYAPYTLAYPLPLPSGRVPVPEPRRFKAKSTMEWTN